MKKFVLLLALYCGSIYIIYAQNSIHLVSTNNAGTATISVIPNGGGFTITTTPSSYDVPAKFRFYNTSSTDTYTYNVIRNIHTINTQGVNTATTYFCVGATCLPPTANSLTPADYITLSPGNYDALIAYFSELSTLGYSEVSYKIYNVNNPADSLRFTIYYNPSLSSVKENNIAIDNLSFYPNPVQNSLNITAKVNMPMSINISLFNILGNEVHQQTMNLNNGYFKKTIDVSNLPSGIYFLKINNTQTGQNIVTKKIIVQ
ncbi:MAG: hypothetical protein OHK0036_11790 [Bacteroidia bacterium]